MKISDYIDYSEEVIEALQNNKPVVAIETGGTFEGIPYPDNVEIAEKVMEAVRANGATPAYISIMNGKIKIINRISTYINMLTYTHVRTDVYAALDHYFHYWNKGRPFILAGHSQGSAIVQIILDEYLNVHPELYDRMVAAYSIGFAVSKDLCERHKDKFTFAQKANDTHVVVSWNTTGPEANAQGAIFCDNCLSINPLNWSTNPDEQASKDLNHGRLMPVHYLHSWEISTDPNDLCDACIKMKGNRSILVNTVITIYRKTNNNLIKYVICSFIQVHTLL